MPVYELVDDFNEIMKKVVDLVEDAKSKIQVIDDVGFGEAAARIREIDEICEDAKKQLDEAANVAEEVLGLLGQR